MIDGIRIKVCGLTSLVDAEFADRCGADYLGFILYPKSPRFVALETIRAMAKHLPDRKKVAVSVEPTAAELMEMKAAGFDFFQVHFKHDLALEAVAAWSATVGADKLWLAPKLPPAADVPPALLPFAKFFLLDTFHAEKFGGTGLTGDWAKFSRHQQSHADKTWILSGGLNPDNIGEALRASGARWVDVNSGVESAPGVKDHAKLKAFVVALHRSQGSR
ncbi:MAG: phosphoribosylanthranilate isomerase [Verrucomicrobia bacterium]|nr:phosphoribosylanthranilate isomerase [Verrucomicrobiota bacterium]